MRLIFACLLFCLSGVPVWAQTAAPNDANLPPSNATAIANALKALPNQHNATTADRLAAEFLLHQSKADEAQADDLARQWQTLRETADGADDAAAKIEAALA